MRGMSIKRRSFRRFNSQRNPRLRTGSGCCDGLLASERWTCCGRGIAQLPHSDSDINSEEAACSQPLPEEQFAAGELSDRLRIALTRLTEQQAEVFVMRYVEELPYDEIAQRTKSNRNAVGVMLNRARTQLQQLLGSGGDSQREIRSTSQETSS